MKIPVHSSTIRRKEMDSVLTCMVSEKIGPGEMNQKLVQLARETFGVDGATAFRSASIALSYALQALDFPKGAGVIISALAPSWHYQAIVSLGYQPILSDVHPETGLVTAELLDEAVKRGGRLILLHEALGFLPDLQSILALNIPVIEDISQSAGAVLDGKTAGTFGLFAIMGLEETDLLTGGGGALLMASERREAIVQKRLDEAAPRTDILPDINSALAYVQLKELAKNSEIRRGMAELYINSLMQGRHKTITQQGEGTNAMYSFPVVLSSGLKEVKQYASRKDIEIGSAFSGSVAELLGDGLEGCINAKSLMMRCILFPLYPRLGSANAAKIAKVLATLP